MQINNFDSKDGIWVLFLFPTMIAVMILGGVGVGHLITSRSQVPTKVEVAAASPRIDVNVPTAAAPRVEVTSATPQVNIHVPNQLAPIVNVSTPPATVTVLDKREPDKQDKLKAEKPLAPEPQVIPVSAPVKPDKTSMAPLPPLMPKEEDFTIESLYRNADTYIASYCQKNSIQKDAANKKWEEQWKDKVDKSNFSEQVYINNWVIDNRSYFDINKAKPEQIVEACRILLRYRDQNLAMLGAFNEVLTAENIKKTVAFLAAGVK